MPGGKECKGEKESGHKKQRWGWAVGWRTFLERVTRKGLLEKKTSGQRLKEARIQGDGEGLLDRRSIRWKGPMAEGRGGISTGEKEGGRWKEGKREGGWWKGGRSKYY